MRCPVDLAQSYNFLRHLMRSGAATEAPNTGSRYQL
jgi:hypothetical protein